MVGKVTYFAQEYISEYCMERTAYLLLALCDTWPHKTCALPLSILFQVLQHLHTYLHWRLDLQGSPAGRVHQISNLLARYPMPGPLWASTFNHSLCQHVTMKVPPRTLLFLTLTDHTQVTSAWGMGQHSCAKSWMKVDGESKEPSGLYSSLAGWVAVI